MKKAFFAGSFDPFTIGHFQIVRKAREIFDTIFIGIGVNSNKKRVYDDMEMKTAIEKMLKSQQFENVVVITYNELTVDAAKRLGCKWLVRGVRNEIDYKYEEEIADYNYRMAHMQTIYFRAENEFKEISSSKVREIDRTKNTDGFVPKEVIELMRKRV
ncbi:MAG: pantetheine-phosphate adenylyltransferase [Clostridia bacterium]|nr:pantetheine-phosphate adenylyltransferase [Clostridia bacterium]MDD4685927.1 pantetheine-phosphate adenylyltransferase [Clostridia bacterium]